LPSLLPHSSHEAVTISISFEAQSFNRTAIVSCLEVVS
jgi:hypothetical protein